MKHFISAKTWHYTVINFSLLLFLYTIVKLTWFGLQMRLTVSGWFCCSSFVEQLTSSSICSSTRSSWLCCCTSNGTWAVSKFFCQVLLWSLTWTIRVIVSFQIIGNEILSEPSLDQLDRPVGYFYRLEAIIRSRV